MAFQNEGEPVEKRQMLETVSEESENISKQDYYMERMKNIVEKCLDKKERDNAMVSGLKDHFSQMVEEYSEAFGQLLSESQQQTFHEMESVEGGIETSLDRITNHEEEVQEFKEAAISLLSSGCNKRSAEDADRSDSNGTMKKRALDSESNIKQFYMEKMKAIVDKCADKREKDNAIVDEIKSHLSKMVCVLFLFAPPSTLIIL